MRCPYDRPGGRFKEGYLRLEKERYALLKAVDEALTIYDVDLACKVIGELKQAAGHVESIELWQPIATCPLQDAFVVDLWVPTWMWRGVSISAQRVCNCHSIYGKWISRESGDSKWLATATHWMPVPRGPLAK